MFIEISPFAREPVDCVLWVKSDEVVANDYNPNVMAPGEKKLLKQSLEQDGFTQPVVVSEEKDHYLVAVMVIIVSCWEEGPVRKTPGDGFLLPALIRRERGRRPVWPRPSVITGPGKHQITSMSDIVRDLSRLGWSDEIGTELGMDQDEVLRLKRISGLTELFQDEVFIPASTVR